MKSLLVNHYATVFETKLLEEIAREGQFRQIKDRVSLYDIGETLDFMPLILEGTVKVVSEDSEGNEYLLYYLEVGDSCAMTMNCCIAHKESIVRATSEGGTLYYRIPVRKMEEWLVRYESWRSFVFNNYDARMRKLLLNIDSLVFCNLQERLLRYLRTRGDALGSAVLDITHYEIAKDLNSSRVVISRLIKNLVAEKKITALRNQITIVAVE